MDDIIIKTTGSDEGDFQAIEDAGEKLLKQGWQPIDSEPGELLVMQDPVSGNTVTIFIGEEDGR